MCLVLALPKGNFIENKGDSRAAQITHEVREDAALGALLPHWRTLLLDYWFTAQNGWNISRVKLINPSPVSFMKMDLLSVIILMDCYDWTLTVLFVGCLGKERGGQRRWVLGMGVQDERGEGKRYLLKRMHQNKSSKHRRWNCWHSGDIWCIRWHFARHMSR